jgi:hypothetical protein
MGEESKSNDTCNCPRCGSQVIIFEANVTQIANQAHINIPKAVEGKLEISSRSEKKPYVITMVRKEGD